MILELIVSDVELSDGKDINLSFNVYFPIMYFTGSKRGASLKNTFSWRGFPMLLLTVQR